MKKFLYFLLPAVLLFNACSQTNSNPNNNNTGCNSTSVPNVFIEINFNGMTHRVEGYDYEGTKMRPSCLITSNTNPATTMLSITGVSMVCPLGGGVLGGFDNISIVGTKNSIATPGTYTSQNQANGGNIGCSHTSFAKAYSIDTTLSINVTSITTDFVTGTFTCKVIDATSVYPATGSFNVARMN